MNVGWWRGWQGPFQWRWGELCEHDQAIWERSNRSFFVLAGLQWKILMENLTERGAEIAERYTEVRYEDLVRAPEITLRKVLSWSGLADDPTLFEHLQTVDFRDANKSWQTEVSLSEQQVFDELLGPTLDHHGYPFGTGALR
jgi:hypothetical protein